MGRGRGQWLALLFYAALGGWAGRLAELSLAGVGLAIAVFLGAFAPMAFVDHSAVLAAPQDYPRLGHLPVDTRSYYLARVSASLRVLSRMACAFAIPAAIVGRATPEPWALGIGLLGAFVALVVLATGLQRQLARGADAGRLRRRIAGVQMLLILLFINGYALLRAHLGTGVAWGDGLRSSAPLILPDWSWAWWQPGRWFAALAAPGEDLSAVLALVAIGFGVLGTLATRGPGFGPEALELERLPSGDSSLRGRGRAPGSPRNSSLPPREETASGWLRFVYPDGRGRHVFALAWAHLRTDPRLLAQVAAMVPATLLAIGLFIGADEVDIRDGDMIRWTFVYIYAVLLYVVVNEAMTRSSQARAAWVFASMSADPSFPYQAIRRAVRRVILWPYTLALAALLMRAHGHIWPAFLHSLMVAIGIEAVIPIFTVIHPAYPFSEQLSDAKARGRALVRNLVSAAVVAPAFLVLHRFGLEFDWGYWLILTSLGGTAVLTDRLARARLRRTLAGAPR